MVMPSGARPIEAFISWRLKEPLRSEPQIATTLAIACPSVGQSRKEVWLAKTAGLAGLFFSMARVTGLAAGTVVQTGQSCGIPAFSRTALHLAISDATCAVSSSGVELLGCAPTSRIFL